MPTQNLNSYYYKKYKVLLNSNNYFDLTLASDERDYDEEVVFSNDLISSNDGLKLPIKIDLSSTDNNLQNVIEFGDYDQTNTLVSSNYYNPNNLDLNCYSAFTGICDVGLVGTDNGLFTGLTGQTLYYSMGIRNDFKFDPHYRDIRFKMVPVTGYTRQPNVVFSGRPKNTIYNIVSKSANTVGYYHELYGGFYQGFYKLKGYDYEVFPERVNKGWTMEVVIKPRQFDDYEIDTETEEYLNDVYPENAGTFFYFGARAENKFYHYATGTSESFSGYSRITSGLTCIETCGCSNSAVTNSNCFSVYPHSTTTNEHSTNCKCGCLSETVKVVSSPYDAKIDVLSNALSIRLSGCAVNPVVVVKSIVTTGSCITTGTCSTTGITYSTGYTFEEFVSSPIYGTCNYDCEGNTDERWVYISAVFERYRYLEDCDLLNKGGINDIRKETYQSSIDGMSYKLISPPETHSGGTKEQKIHIINFNKKWYDEIKYRLGDLKIYVNGYLFMVIQNFEEIIPRELNTEKEKQVGVPYNISFGGGTQGLHENLIFSSCTEPYVPYIQDPELFPNNILSATTLSGLTTDILLEQNFGGTFMGGISQFRMYTNPLDFSQIQHNYRILKDRFDLIDFWCLDCLPVFYLYTNYNYLETQYYDPQYYE